MTRLTRRRLLLGSVPAPRGRRCPPRDDPAPPSVGRTSAAAAGGAPRRGTPASRGPGGHASFRDGGTVDHGANGFDPHEILRDFDWGTTRRLATGRVLREWELVRRRPGDRGRARRDASPPGPTTGASPGRRCAAARASACGSRFVNGSAPPAHDPLPRHPPGRDGRRARPRRRARSSRAGTTVYEFDALPAGLHLYHCHVRPLAEHIAKGLYGAFIVDPKEGRAGRRRAGDGHERLRHQLRPRERDLRGQHDRLRLHGPPDPGRARRARPRLPRQRPRVRPRQLVPPARQPLRLLPDGHVDARRPSSPTR